MSEDWIDEAAHQLEELIGDPMADAVPATVRVVSASPAEGRARYQECRLVLVGEAAGADPVTVSTVVVFDRKRWPSVGAQAPARMSLSRPTAIDVAWEHLAG